MRTIGTFLFLALILAIGAGAYYGWQMASEGEGAGERGRDGPGGGRQAILVRAEPVTTRAFSDQIEAVGTAKARESIELTAKSAETIGAINFTDGQKVPAGFVVAELTMREQTADVAAARAELSEASKAYDRINELLSRGYATKAQLEAATARRDTAAARVRSLESRVSDREIKTPFAGMLGLRRVSVGSLVRPGDVITTLDDITVIKLDFSVPEAYMGTLSAGMPVRATVAAYPGRVFQGKVAAIDTRVDPVSRAIALRAEINNDGDLLRPGMLMTVALVRNERTVLAVPEQCLVPIENKQYVFVVTADMKAERREVVIGARQPGYVEILSGLKAGERVVVDGTVRLRAGATVRFGGPEGEKDRPRERGRDGEAAAGPRT